MNFRQKIRILREDCNDSSLLAPFEDLMDTDAGSFTLATRSSGKRRLKTSAPTVHQKSNDSLIHVSAIVCPFESHNQPNSNILPYLYFC